MGGTWDTTQYDLTIPKGPTSRGVDIRLEFDPKDPVDATKIGLTQAVKTRKAGNPYVSNNNPTLTARTVPVGQAGGEYRTDRLKERANPIYGTDDAANLESSAFSGQKAVDNKIGWHYRDASKNVVHEKAKLYDTPNIGSGADKNSGHTFETTALAIKGNQAGTYYGSVRWGYQTDNAGVHTKLPLEVVSFGVPTTNFVEAAKLWNVTPASTGTASLKLPVNFVALKVEVAYATKPGQNVFLAGSAPELGSWNPAHAFALQYLGPGKWGGKELEYKYVVKEGGNVRWEEGANHKRTLPAAGASTTIQDSWHEKHMGHRAFGLQVCRRL